MTICQTLKCGKCNNRMHYDSLNDVYKCTPCAFYTSGCYLQEAIASGIIIDETPPAATLPDDCKCKHCHYDHIGFRDHLEGTARLRTSCRIAYCRCEGYNINNEFESQEYDTNYQSKSLPSFASFNPSYTYGETIGYIGRYDAIPQATKDIFHKKAKAILPSGQYYELRAIIPKSYGLDKAIYWIYESWMNKPHASFWFPDLNPPQLNSNLSCYIIGGYRA